MRQYSKKNLIIIIIIIIIIICGSSSSSPNNSSGGTTSNNNNAGGGSSSSNSFIVIPLLSKRYSHRAHPVYCKGRYLLNARSFFLTPKLISQDFPESWNLETPRSGLYLNDAIARHCVRSLWIHSGINVPWMTMRTFSPEL
jgi:hypothetical protein